MFPKIRSDFWLLPLCICLTAIWKIRAVGMDIGKAVQLILSEFIWISSKSRKQTCVTVVNIYSLCCCTSQPVKKRCLHVLQLVLCGIGWTCFSMCVCVCVCVFVFMDQECFGGSSVSVPEMEGVLWLKEDGKKSWKKRYFLLRASGIYYVPKGKAKVGVMKSVRSIYNNMMLFCVLFEKKKNSIECLCLHRHPETWCVSSSWIMSMCILARTTRASTRLLQTTAWCWRYALKHKPKPHHRGMRFGMNDCWLVCGTVSSHCLLVVWQSSDSFVFERKGNR